jgi:hypothetical protein
MKDNKTISSQLIAGFSPFVKCRSHSHHWIIPLSIWFVSYLVGGFFPPEKHESQLGLLFPIHGKINMFQTTNQL